jgi:hypothetical protein
MRGPLIAALIGAVLAVGAGFGTGAVLSGATNGQPGERDGVELRAALRRAKIFRAGPDS